MQVSYVQTCFCKCFMVIEVIKKGHKSLRVDCLETGVKSVKTYSQGVHLVQHEMLVQHFMCRPSNRGGNP